MMFGRHVMINIITIRATYDFGTRVFGTVVFGTIVFYCYMYLVLLYMLVRQGCTPDQAQRTRQVTSL